MLIILGYLSYVSENCKWSIFNLFAEYFQRVYTANNGNITYTRGTCFDNSYNIGVPHITY